MTTQNKTQSTAEKVKAFAMGFIGALFFTLGISYFKEQAQYKVPRILVPVLELFGHIGLAIGLLILGAILIFLSYLKFKKHGVKPLVILIVLSLTVTSIFTVFKLIEYSDFSKNKIKEERLKQELYNKVENAERPKLNNQNANEHLDKMEFILQEMTKSKEQNDDAKFKTLDKEYLALNQDLATIIPELSKTDKYQAFIMYRAGLSRKINSLRGIKN